MPVCIRCRRTLATAELRRRKPPHTGEYVCKSTCKPIGPSDHVTTTLGRGIVTNVARRGSETTAVLVMLDADRERGLDNIDRNWRAFRPEEIGR